MPLSILRGRDWPAPGEPLFTEHDTAMAIAYERWLSERCDRCKTFHSEWVDPLTGRRRTPDPYVPELTECPGCTMIDTQLAQVRKAMDRAQSNRAIGVRLDRNPDTIARYPLGG